MSELKDDIKVGFDPFEEMAEQQFKERTLLINDSLWIRNFLTFGAIGLASVLFDNAATVPSKLVAVILVSAALIFAYLENLTILRLANNTATGDDTRFLRRNHLPAFLFKLPLHKIFPAKVKR